MAARGYIRTYTTIQFYIAYIKNSVKNFLSSVSAQCQGFMGQKFLYGDEKLVA
jgi:hypothetical protein